MSGKKAKITFISILLAFAGIIFAVWYFGVRSDQPELDQSSSEATSSSPSSLSVGQSSNPYDLGQIPMSNNSGGLTPENSTSSSSSGPDSSQFKQYDKYRSSESALFAEIKKGSGASAASGKKTVIVYRTWLTDGTLVDASKKDKEGKYIPVEFTFGRGEVIPGLEQGLDGMKAGGSRLIIVPPIAGYGNKKHENVPPNSVLVFEVYLVKVK